MFEIKNGVDPTKNEVLKNFDFFWKLLIMLGKVYIMLTKTCPRRLVQTFRIKPEEKRHFVIISQIWDRLHALFIS